MKKIILMFLTILCLGLSMNVYAASATIAVKSSSNQVIVGKEATVYVTISSQVSLGSWEYTLNYDKSVWKLVSSDADLHYAFVAPNPSTKSVTYKYVFKALKSGTSKFYIDSSAVASWDSTGEFMDVKDGSISVKTLTYSEYQASLSANNNLKSLVVEGYEITPEFNKDTFEYNVKVNEDEKTIKVAAIAEDKTATVTGAGELEVSAGNNSFDILVIAQNGSEKTYKLNVEVIDKDPIEVTLAGKKYTVVKLASNLVKSESYNETTVVIDEFDIPAFYSEVTEFTLVGLKDEEGNVGLYIYDDGKYEVYNELNFGNITIYPQKMNESIKDYKKYTTKINDVTIEVLALKKNSRFKLIYGLNVVTKEEGLYLYDSKDNAIVKYDSEYIEILQNKNTMLMYSTIAFIGSTILALFGIIGLSKKKKNKKTKKSKVIENNIEEENVETSENEINEIIEDKEEEVYDIFESDKKKKKGKKE